MAMARLPDKLHDDNECRYCCEISNKKYFCSDDHAIKFAEAFAEVGYTFKYGKPVVNWTIIEPKEQ
tara:strand:- start:681 stop:878 length:198 start_codon:yes stop_codon:yes gene_type:complete